MYSQCERASAMSGWSSSPRIGISLASINVFLTDFVFGILDNQSASFALVEHGWGLTERGTVVRCSLLTVTFTSQSCNGHQQTVILSINSKVEFNFSLANRLALIAQSTNDWGCLEFYDFWKKTKSHSRFLGGRHHMYAFERTKPTSKLWEL